MFNNDVFKNAYLSSISLIKEDIDQPEAGDEAVEEKLMKVTFVTSDAALIETINSAIEEIVFRVKDEETADATDPGATGYSEVIFSPASFGELEIEEVEEEDEDDVAEECGDGEGDAPVEEDEEIVEEEDEEVVEEDEDGDGETETVEGDGETEEDDEEVTNECKSPIYRAKRFSKYGY